MPNHTTKQIENCEPGDILDMGVFLKIDPRDSSQGPNTVNVRIWSMISLRVMHYTETTGARVNVWRNYEAWSQS